MPKIIPRFKQETSKKIARFHYELNQKLLPEKIPRFMQETSKIIPTINF